MHPEIGHTVTRVITPEVKKAAERHFDCPGLDGGELEDGGSRETAGSHWEKSVFLLRRIMSSNVKEFLRTST